MFIFFPNDNVIKFHGINPYKLANIFVLFRDEELNFVCRHVFYTLLATRWRSGHEILIHYWLTSAVTDGYESNIAGHGGRDIRVTALELPPL